METKDYFTLIGVIIIAITVFVIGYREVVKKEKETKRRIQKIYDETQDDRISFWIKIEEAGYTEHDVNKYLKS